MGNNMKLNHGAVSAEHKEGHFTGRSIDKPVDTPVSCWLVLLREEGVYATCRKQTAHNSLVLPANTVRRLTNDSIES